MSNISGLQIDPRCIKCDTPPTVNRPLFEMQNHLYICQQCRQIEESRGKHINWAGDAPAQMQTSGQATTMVSNPPGLQTASLPDQASKIPKNGMFGTLGIEPTTSKDIVEQAIEEKTLFWMRDASPDAQAKIEQLREWQEALSDDATFLQRQVDKVRPRKAQGSALSLAGKAVYSAQELLATCEASKQGWEDAEALLQGGNLEPWIRYQVGNPMIANEANRLVQANVPMHRVLNYVLYRLVPERPFRFYKQEIWQSISSIPSAETPGELAACCDKNWTSGEWHLYKGAMIAWLELSQGCKDLSNYYATSIQPYAGEQAKRGLGLELILEKVVPRLTHPKLVVTFDGIQDDSYFQDAWDREIPHLPITVGIRNDTRGFSSLTLELVRTRQKPSVMEPDWIYLDASRPAPTYGTPYSVAPPVQSQPVIVYGRNEAGMPATRQIKLTNLAQLGRGRRYERTLRILEHREYDREPVVHEYPIALKTMWFFQGFRGILWRYGLRGDLPGLVWNALLGMLLALIVSQLLLKNVPIPSYTWYGEAMQNLDFLGFLKVSAVGFFVELQQLPRISFVLLTGIILGIAGFFTGMSKGHATYGEREGARAFRKGAFWLSLLSFFVLLFLMGGYPTLQYAFSYGDGGSVVAAIFATCGSFLTSCLIFLLACIAAFMRAGLEKFLRRRYAALLKPKGGE